MDAHSISDTRFAARLPFGKTGSLWQNGGASLKGIQNEHAPLLRPFPRLFVGEFAGFPRPIFRLVALHHAAIEKIGDDSLEIELGIEELGALQAGV